MKYISINIPFKKISMVLLTFLLFYFSSCGLYRPTDARKVSPNADERIAQNQKDGRGFRLGGIGKTKGGTFDFASSNDLWRATIDVLDFVPFVNASYSGGILITEWFNGDSKKNNERRDLKITVRFLTNEIRADSLDINIHERMCKVNLINCDIKEIKSKLESEIKLAILKKAAYLEKDRLKKN
mgnify:CR=1 FL=1|tara:strand:- start:409 stop:960 length:552 start_codon:yes stop_codon:yes gene_type:complete